MKNSNEDRMPDPLDFVAGQKTAPMSSAAKDTPLAIPPRTVLKKHSVVVNLLTAILLTPLIIIGIIVAIIFGFSVSHGSELNKLKNETTNLFGTSNFAPSTYDCHDVELRNTCYFTLSKSDAVVESFLLSRGFSKNATYGNGYQKDNLYIDNNSKGTYSSFYVK